MKIRSLGGTAYFFYQFGYTLPTNRSYPYQFGTTCFNSIL